MAPLVHLVVLLVKLIIFLIKLLFRGLKAVIVWAPKRQDGRLATPPLPKSSHPSASMPVQATSIDLVLRPIIDELEELSRDSIERAERCRDEAPNLRFVRSFEYVAKRANHLAGRLRQRDLALVRELSGVRGHLESVFEVTSFMAAQRRDQELLDLLGDTDALAEACYRPIVEHCREYEIPLSSDRAVTVVDGDKLYLFSVDDPTGLATVVLPGAFASELGWWPALAHEIGHDFYRSVKGLPDDLLAHLGISADPSLPTGAAMLSDAELERALFAWHEELFADAFGTMMLGPAYVLTMMWTFGKEGREQATRAAALEGGRFEEHPPSHVRVAAACRLLGRMGYGAEGDRLEAEWRKRVGPFERVLFPTPRGFFLQYDDDPVIERAARVGTLLYQQGMPSLGEQPLRSIFGLDFGPKEHAQATLVASRLAGGRPPLLRDPRLLIAGGVLAWFERPGQAANTYRLVRQAIPGVAEARRAPNEEVEEGSASTDMEMAPSLVRDALILGSLLGEPRSVQPFRSSRAR